jgi:hypothetical protein
MPVTDRAAPCRGRSRTAARGQRRRRRCGCRLTESRTTLSLCTPATNANSSGSTIRSLQLRSSQFTISSKVISFWDGDAVAFAISESFAMLNYPTLARAICGCGDGRELPMDVQPFTMTRGVLGAADGHRLERPEARNVTAHHACAGRRRGQHIRTDRRRNTSTAGSPTPCYGLARPRDAGRSASSVGEGSNSMIDPASLP